MSVLRSQPANQSAHVLLGDVYRDQNRLDDAIQWYGMAVDLRPNPTDQAKLEQVKQQRERQRASDALRVSARIWHRRVGAIDRGTDLNTGTVNLMGVSPRRWLRGITTISVAFVMLALVALVWNLGTMATRTPMPKRLASAARSERAPSTCPHTIWTKPCPPTP